MNEGRKPDSPFSEKNLLKKKLFFNNLLQFSKFPGGKMVYLNKISVVPYAKDSDSSRIQPESRSFEQRIRAAKILGSQIIPEGDLSNFEWEVMTRREKQAEPESWRENTHELCYDAVAFLFQSAHNELLNAYKATTKEPDGWIRKGRPRDIKRTDSTPVNFSHPNPFQKLQMELHSKTE